MPKLIDLGERTEIPLLVSFLDLTRFAVESQQRPDRRTADVLDEYYHRVATAIQESEGTLVKFMGDAALAVHSELSIDRGVLGLLNLKQQCDTWLSEQGWSSRVQVKSAFGPAIAGPFGPSRTFDVIGKTVNAAARLRGSGVVMSESAFHKLGPRLRQRFREHAAPTTFIVDED